MGRAACLRKCGLLVQMHLQTAFLAPYAYGIDTASAGDAPTNPQSRIPNPGLQGIVNAIGVDFIAAEIDGNGSTLAMVITSSIDTTSQVMLSSFTHR
ncbi:hypothetical protein HEP74_00366 [Xanthomonas sp. SS]|nr:hypothetical protein HEP75_00373 [Xanthomonas sp. SI]QNH15248.1 hypothetical protein HEP74_00366 [Xanthomonas sp. SS]